VIQVHYTMPNTLNYVITNFSQLYRGYATTICMGICAIMSIFGSPRHRFFFFPPPFFPALLCFLHGYLRYNVCLRKSKTLVVVEQVSFLCFYV
jgi:hypothetical protein